MTASDREKEIEKRREKSPAPGGFQTHDLLITSHVLYCWATTAAQAISNETGLKPFLFADAVSNGDKSGSEKNLPLPLSIQIVLKKYFLSKTRKSFFSFRAVKTFWKKSEFGRVAQELNKSCPRIKSKLPMTLTEDAQELLKSDPIIEPKLSKIQDIF